LLTTWILAAPRQALWDVLADVRSWPQWWRGVEAASELEAGDERRVGSRYRVRWHGRLPYRVELEFAVETVREPLLMAGRSDGDLAGSGTWRLFEHGGVSAVTYEWDVRPTRAWMRALTPVARPVFRAEHDRLMRAGGDGLARQLGVRAIALG